MDLADSLDGKIVGGCYLFRAGDRFFCYLLESCEFPLNVPQRADL